MWAELLTCITHPNRSSWKRLGESVAEPWCSDAPAAPLAEITFSSWSRNKCFAHLWAQIALFIHPRQSFPSEQAIGSNYALNQSDSTTKDSVYTTIYIYFFFNPVENYAQFRCNGCLKFLLKVSWDILNSCEKIQLSDLPASKSKYSYIPVD